MRGPHGRTSCHSGCRAHTDDFTTTCCFTAVASLSVYPSVRPSVRLLSAKPARRSAAAPDGGGGGDDVACALTHSLNSVALLTVRARKVLCVKALTAVTRYQMQELSQWLWLS
jgi:hypothetical protein